MPELSDLYDALATIRRFQATLDEEDQDGAALARGDLARLVRFYGNENVKFMIRVITEDAVQEEASDG